jgi:hypothetical protein
MQEKLILSKDCILDKWMDMSYVSDNDHWLRRLIDNNGDEIKPLYNWVSLSRNYKSYIWIATFGEKGVFSFCNKIFSFEKEHKGKLSKEEIKLMQDEVDQFLIRVWKIKLFI